MPELPQRHVVVTYRRQLSDGNYGTESAEVSLDWYIDQDNDSEVDLDFANEMLVNATNIALGRLHQSTNANVRRATHPITPAKVAPTTPAEDEDLPF